MGKPPKTRKKQGIMSTSPWRLNIQARLEIRPLVLPIHDTSTSRQEFRKTIIDPTRKHQKPWKWVHKFRDFLTNQDSIRRVFREGSPINLVAFRFRAQLFSRHGPVMFPQPNLYSMQLENCNRQWVRPNLRFHQPNRAPGQLCFP